MVIPKLPKLEPWVRFPSPAPFWLSGVSLFSWDARLRSVEPIVTQPPTPLSPENVGRLPAQSLRDVEAGIRLVLAL
jgi:hypothetical protein